MGEDELNQPAKSQKVSKPNQLFGAEDSEAESASDSEGRGVDDDDFRMTSSSVFALGWQAMINIKQATFWKQNQDDQTIAKKKRPYDKTNRSANALYLREKSGVYKKNGSDPSRINSLIQKDSCLCAMEANIRTMFTKFGYIVYYIVGFCLGGPICPT